jgi:uncharacterized membrane protein
MWVRIQTESCTSAVQYLLSSSIQLLHEVVVVSVQVAFIHSFITSLKSRSDVYHFSLDAFLK